MVVGERIADRYELEEVVGHGGMSTVYKAHDSLLERNVALKVLHQQYNEDEDFVDAASGAIITGFSWHDSLARSTRALGALLSITDEHDV